jgi:Sulfotransferase family
MTQLIFILSLRRAGSTLLQRLLLADGRCASIGEHHLMLRFLGDNERLHRYAGYSEGNVQTSINDLRDACPTFDDVYREGVHEMSMNIYRELAGDKECFLDKTPLYCLIAEELIQTFPEAKFVVLWRHPLAVAASMISTWNRNKWDIEDHGIDLFTGMDRLMAFAKKHENVICQINYEDLVSDSSKSLKKISDYLGWDHLEKVLDTPLPKGNNGKLGDPTGVNKYTNVSTESRDAWMNDYSNWFRRKWAADYFSGQRGVNLAQIGYNLPQQIFEEMPRNFVAGFREWARAAKGRRKVTRRTLSAKNQSEQFRMENGYYLKLT